MASAFEIVQENRKKIVDEIIKQMESGHFFNSPKWNKYLVSPRNPHTKTVYRGGNKIRLMQEAIKNEYTDPRWMTFNQIKEAGYSLDQGSKGVMCEKWIFEQTKKERDPDTGKIVEITEELIPPRVNYFYVFNAKNIKGLPELEKKVFENEKILDVADRLIASSQCPIKEIAQDQPYYSPGNDYISLPLRSIFRSEHAFLRTTLHEMSHSTGHHTRLNRTFGYDKTSPTYAREEIRAELGSLFTRLDLGIELPEETLGDHANYFTHYIKMLKDDPNELFRACSDADKISDYLVSNYEAMLEIENERVKDNKNILSMENAQKQDVVSTEQIKTFSLYQLKENEYCKKFRYENLDVWKNQKLEPSLDNYEKVYAGELKPGQTLESIYTRFNIDHPVDFRGHSASVSDIISINNGSEIEAYYINNIGYQKLENVSEQIKVLESHISPKILIDECIKKINAPHIIPDSDIQFDFHECLEFPSMGKSTENIKNIKTAYKLYSETMKVPHLRSYLPGINARVGDDWEFKIHPNGRDSLSFLPKEIRENKKILKAIETCETLEKKEIKTNELQAENFVAKEKFVDELTM